MKAGVNLEISPPTFSLGLQVETRIGKPSLNVGHKMSAVWYYPARGLCSPGHALMFENYSGCILPWEWSIPDPGHGFTFRETGAMQILGAMARAKRLEVASISILKSIQVCGASSLLLEHLELHTER